MYRSCSICSSLSLDPSKIAIAGKIGMCVSKYIVSLDIPKTKTHSYLYTVEVVNFTIMKRVSFWIDKWIAEDYICHIQNVVIVFV